MLQVRVNYYIRELYGNPGDFHDAWETPFGVMAKKAQTKLFVHPAVEKVRKGAIWSLPWRAGQ